MPLQARIDRIAAIITQVRQGIKLRIIGERIGVSKQRIHQLAARSPDYAKAKLEGMENRSLDIARGGDSRTLLRYLRRSLIPIAGVRRVALGLFRGPCSACGSQAGVLARTGDDGGVAECIDCGWRGRADVYVLGRESKALHIVHKRRERTT